jgi:Protein of unknown function (DUF2917)
MFAPRILKRDDQTLALDSALTVHVRSAGTLSICASSVWMTVDGEAKDRVLQGGERLDLQAGHRLVIEPWFRGQAAQLHWKPAASAVCATRRATAFLHMNSRVAP